MPQPIDINYKTITVEEIELISNPEILKEIVLNSEKFLIRTGTMVFIQDESIIKDILFQSSDNHVKILAFNKIKKEELLMEIAININASLLDKRFAIDAVDKIKNEDTLKEVAINGSEKIRSIAIEKIVKRETLQELLTYEKTQKSAKKRMNDLRIN